MNRLASNENTMIYMYTYFGNQNFLYREYEYVKI